MENFEEESLNSDILFESSSHVKALKEEETTCDAIITKFTHWKVDDQLVIFNNSQNHEDKNCQDSESIDIRSITSTISSSSTSTSKINIDSASTQKKMCDRSTNTERYYKPKNWTFRKPYKYNAYQRQRYNFHQRNQRYNCSNPWNPWNQNYEYNSYQNYSQNNYSMKWQYEKFRREEYFRRLGFSFHLFSKFMDILYSMRY